MCVCVCVCVCRWSFQQYTVEINSAMIVLVHSGSHRGTFTTVIININIDNKDMSEYILVLLQFSCFTATVFARRLVPRRIDSHNNCVSYLLLLWIGSQIPKIIFCAQQQMKKVELNCGNTLHHPYGTQHTHQSFPGIMDCIGINNWIIIIAKIYIKIK